MPIAASGGGTYPRPIGFPSVGDGAPDMTVRLSLEHAKDGRLRGSTSAMGSTSWFSDGTWDEASAKASFEVMTDFGKIPYALRREGEAIAGTLEAMGNRVELRGEREGGQ